MQPWNYENEATHLNRKFSLWFLSRDNKEKDPTFTALNHYGHNNLISIFRSQAIRYEAWVIYRFVFPCARQVFEWLNEGEKGNGMERLVTLDTTGLSDDALHVLDLPLAAAEGAELIKMLACVLGVTCSYGLQLAGIWLNREKGFDLQSGGRSCAIKRSVA